MTTGLRLGVYADLRYEQRVDVAWCDNAFVRFLAALAPHVDRLAVAGRVGRVNHPVAALRADEAELVALPDYRSLTDVGAVARAVHPSVTTWRERMGELDAALLFGPHPIALALARECRRAGVPVVLGVRQDLPAYLVNRASDRARPIVSAVAHSLEQAWRRLAREHATVVTGDDLARAYRDAPRLLDVAFSLVGADRVLPPVDRPWGDEVDVLSVGRLDPEKNPLLLADVADGLGRSWPGWRLRVVGTGSLADRLDTRRRALRLGDRLVLAGAVPHGDALWDEYRGADAFVHVSHTEGQPQVLLEAMAAGLPIVATAVGGVPSLLGHGERGLLVPPDDPRAAVAALERLRRDPVLRDRLTAAGRAHAHATTTEIEAGRVADLVADVVGVRAR